MTTDTTRAHSTHPATQPGRLVLDVSTSLAHTGTVDGGFRAESRDLDTEVRRLVTRWPGTVERVLYRLAEWDRAPRKIATHGRWVRLDGYRSQPPHTLVVLGSDGRRTVLVVPPLETDDAVAESILTASALTTGVGTIPELLGHVLTNHAPFTDPVVAGSRWDSDGGAPDRS